MPAFKIHVEARPAEATAYAKASYQSSKFQLQSDKGGEGGNGIEDLIEGFIPRFTEIIEPLPPSAEADVDVAELSQASRANGTTDHVQQEVRIMASFGNANARTIANDCTITLSKLLRLVKASPN